MAGSPREKLGGRFFGRYGGFAFLFGRRPSGGRRGVGVRAGGAPRQGHGTAGAPVLSGHLR